MALYSKTITGLLNGVSRQPYAMRLESQGEEQINCISSVAKGVKRRPGIKLVASLSASPVSGDAWHWIDRSPTQRYLVRVQNASTTIGVTDLIAGTTSLVTGNAYTTVSGASDYIRFLTIGDVTYITNTSKQPTMTSATTATLTRWAFVWVKAAIPAAKYSINCCVAGGTAREYTDTTASPTTTTEAIAVQLATKINTAATDFIAMSFGSIIAITQTADSQTADFTISTSDGWGDQALVAVKNGATVQSFASLPPVGIDGMTCEVDGDQETSVDSYWVKFAVASGTAAKTTGASYGGATRAMGTGTWEECPKPTLAAGTISLNTKVHTTIDNTTMPQTLTWDGTSWTVSAVTWGARTVGDNLTAPRPDFLSDYSASALPSTAPKIVDMAFFKNRLAICSGESVSFSGLNDYTSFFPTTVVSVADDDGFDVEANFPDVAKLRYAVPFADMLVLFAESGIFGIRSGAESGLTPKSVTFERLTNFTGTPSTRPAVAGDRIFFTEDQNTRTVMREFRRDPSSEDAYVVESISEHVVDYVDASTIRDIAADPVSGMLSVVGGTWGPKTWIYQWFDSNREKVQSSWHAWSLNGDFAASAQTQLQVFGTTIIKGDVYYVVWMPRVSNTSMTVIKVPTDPVVYSGTSGLGPISATSDAIPYIDYWSSVVGTNVGGNAVFDISAPINCLNNTSGIVALAYGSGWSASERGSHVAGGTASNVTDLTMRLTFTGTTYVGRTLFIGVASRAGYDFTPPVRKNQNNTPELSGRYFARRWRARFTKPATVVCHQTVGPSTTGNRTHNRTLSITQKVKAEFPIHREIDYTLNTGFYTESHTLGFELWSVEWDLEWSPTARSL